MGRAARARRPPEIHAADAPCAPAPRDAPPARSPGAGEARLALLSAAVRSSPGPVVVTDALDRVVAASEGLLRAIGREESDVRGEPFASLIAREEGAPRAGTRLREAERGGWQGDLLFRGGGAARAPVRAAARAVRSPEGAVLGYVTLGQESDAHRDAERRKDRFLALIGHELRTPLASVQGFARLLVEEPDMAPDLRAGYLAVLDAEASRLRELLEDLLRAARLQSGEWRLAPRPLDPFSAVRDIVDRAVPLARAQGRTLLLGPLPPGARVLADPDLWPLTLRNVLQNAIRYGAEGGTVTVGGAVQDGEAVVTVTDDGPGIDEDELPRVFDRFFRGRASAGVPGTGLGLSIARDVAWRHRGDLVLRRGTGGGTVAEARWPLVLSGPRR